MEAVPCPRGCARAGEWCNSAAGARKRDDGKRDDGKRDDGKRDGGGRGAGSRFHLDGFR